MVHKDHVFTGKMTTTRTFFTTQMEVYQTLVDRCGYILSPARILLRWGTFPQNIAIEVMLLMVLFAMQLLSLCARSNSEISKIGRAHV